MKINASIATKVTKRRSTTIGTLVGTRFQTELLEAIDTWRKLQPDLPTRPEAVRRLVEAGMYHDINQDGSQLPLQLINQQK